MTQPVSIDVVICTYNNAPMLSATLRALAAQRVRSEVDWRVLVVDNNCTDNTGEVVAELAATIGVPLSVVVEPRQGLTPARLCGVLNSRGHWIAFVDDDCILDPDWVENAAAFAREHPDCGAFGGQVVLQWQAPPPTYVEGYTYAFAENLLGSEPLRRDWLAGAGMVLRRAALEATGWTQRQFLEDRIGTRLVSGGDVEIGIRIAAQFDVWYAPECRLQHIIPARRTALPYLRRLVFGLGASSHAIAALTWRGTRVAWWKHSVREFARLLAQSLRRLAHDLRGNHDANNLPLTFAFPLGWLSAAWKLLRMPRGSRRAWVGGLVAEPGKHKGQLA